MSEMTEVFEDGVLVGWYGSMRDTQGERKVFIPRRERDIITDRDATNRLARRRNWNGGALDMTRNQAAAWVVSEMAKLDTPTKRSARILIEENTLKLAGLVRGIPNTLWAHEELLRRLRVVF